MSWNDIRIEQNQTYENCIRYLYRDPVLFKYMVNRDPRIVKKALELYGDNIRYIEDQTEKNAIDALMSNVPASLKYIKNPTERVKLMAINKSTSNIRYIKDPSYDVCEIVIKKGHLSCISRIPAECIEKYDLEKLIYKYRKDAVTVISNPSDWLVEKVFSDAKSARHIALIASDALAMRAVKLNPDCFEHFRWHTDSMIEHVLRVKPKAALSIINTLDEDSMIKAVMKDPSILSRISDQKPTVCAMAVKKDPKAVNYIASLKLRKEIAESCGIPLNKNLVYIENEGDLVEHRNR